ncbi:MAG: beta-ketoacyl-ACP synthase II [Chloroflexi bacterium]|nr:beta-ketoacyl-ACP synthase II [Chloroflexota bacterium]MDA1239646.1 beta-ketoacyl-ACP synthase II [Chloroflexota bacterium]MQC25604.1 beta-ketoacyl-[acyl-carrier-protein] synthase II [Chloroflexota bacterium]MQC47865.1 beta-ketoacyl-[acyl-carrier-protein] synthase II [Chloroflexota bacterium]
MRRVVVTGLGLITPVGLDTDSTWEALIAGVSGIGLLTRFDGSAYEQPIVGEVKGFEVSDHVDAKIARRIDLSSAYAIAAAKQAVEDAGLDMTTEDARRVGVILGTGMGSAHLIVEQQRILDEKGPRRISPFLTSHMLPDTATGLVGIEIGARGPNFAITAACATGGATTGEAAEIIARGEADVIIAGGFEAPIQPIYYAGFSAMKALATHEDPKKAVRPFDLTRNGFIIAEGAGVLVLEDLDHALARGARIYAEWRGSATSNDAEDMVGAAEDGHGIGQAMEDALARAGMQPEDLDYINAHGTGTPLNDRVETTAIRRLFREHADALVVSSTKSMHGHMMGAAGAVEAAVAVLTCHHGVIPPTINYVTPDPACDLDYAPNEARVRPVRAAMSTSVGLGGHNSAIIFSRWEG